MLSGLKSPMKKDECFKCSFNLAVRFSWDKSVKSDAVLCSFCMRSNNGWSLHNEPDKWTWTTGQFEDTRYCGFGGGRGTQKGPYQNSHFGPRLKFFGRSEEMLRRGVLHPDFRRSDFFGIYGGARRRLDLGEGRLDIPVIQTMNDREPVSDGE